MSLGPTHEPRGAPTVSRRRPRASEHRETRGQYRRLPIKAGAKEAADRKCPEARTERPAARVPLLAPWFGKGLHRLLAAL